MCCSCHRAVVFSILVKQFGLRWGCIVKIVLIRHVLYMHTAVQTVCTTVVRCDCRLVSNRQTNRHVFGCLVLPLGTGGNFSDVYNSDQPFNPNTNPNPYRNERIPRTLGQRCGRCSLGKVCVGRSQIDAPGADFDANAFCAR